MVELTLMKNAAERQLATEWLPQNGPAAQFTGIAGRGGVGAMAEPDNVVLQHLRAIREILDNHTDRLLELQQRMGRLEVQVANMSVRIDRIDMRLDRVEKRLGLIEA